MTSKIELILNMLKNNLESQYDRCLKSMFQLRRFGIKLGLSTITDILNKLGNPQDSFISIHIAGTNGKGSVASTLAGILHESGYDVGLYTSPHMVKFNERICVNGTMVSDEEVVTMWKMIKTLGLSGREREATFFELVTAMAFYQFNHKKVKFAIIETGMGGMHDATNVIFPILSIITNVSMEHKEHLGNSIVQISNEKAGIIKPKAPVITGITQKNAISVISKTAEKMGSELILKGRDFRIRKNKSGLFTYKGKYSEWNKMSTNLLGSHQIDNASLVLAACEVLGQSMNLPLSCIRSGLSNNNWKGRIEVALKSPYVILDGAHNFMAARNLGRFLKQNMSKKKITLVIGILDDKPYKTMFRSLIPHCFRVIITRPRIKRALSIEKMERAVRLFTDKVEIFSDVGEALIYAIETSKTDDVVCVAGSLYVVGEAKIALNHKYNVPH